MEFKALPLLIAAPIHEHAVGGMHGEDRHQHVDADAECRNAGEKTRDQADGTEELGRDGEEGEYGRDVPFPEELHCAVETWCR